MEELTLNEQFDEIIKELDKQTFTKQEMEEIVYKRDEIKERKILKLLEKLIVANERIIALQEENEKLMSMI